MVRLKTELQQESLAIFSDDRILKRMRILITAGPTHEPIDAVRYIGNRSSGRMGLALAEASLAAGHQTTVISGPAAIAWPATCRTVEVTTAAQMHEAVLREWPNHDLLIMAAAVADYRPKTVRPDKTPREAALTIECEATPDIVADAARIKRPDQRIVGFSLEAAGGIERAREKLKRKNLQLIVYNGAETMNSQTIRPTLLWADGRSMAVEEMAKERFAETLLMHATQLE